MAIWLIHRHRTHGHGHFCAPWRTQVTMTKEAKLMRLVSDLLGHPRDQIALIMND
jgi:hypothetical protein